MNKELTYPTVDDLGFEPVRAIERERGIEWFRQWEAVRHNKQRLDREGEPLLVEFGRSPLPTDYGDWTYITYGDRTTGLHHDVIVYGNIEESLGDGEDILTRVHSACKTNEVFHASNCECRKEIQQAMTDIQKEGRGIIIYLEQEGRGTGMSGKMAQLYGMFEWKNGKIEQRRTPDGQRVDTDMAYKQAGFPSECRDFAVAGEILQRIGVKSVRMITNNPEKIKGIEGFGIPVKPVAIHISPDNQIIASDLKSKAINLGHNIDPEHYAYKER